jgi:hypothetical protein
MCQLKDLVLRVVVTVGCILPVNGMAQVGLQPFAVAAGGAVAKPNIQIAIYASPRTGQSFDVTDQLKAACLATPGSCLVSCGNQLAGDPDFGTPKFCRIVYSAMPAARRKCSCRKVSMQR